jgi:ElaB/YqjD/DUF883 family membrane-anchored ribosome-binding protein
MYVAIFSSIFIVLFALLILFYLDINFKLSEYVEQFEEGNKIILNKLADVRDDVDTMNVELRGEVSKIKNKMNSHTSGHVNSEKVKKDIKQWNDSIKQNEKIFKTMNSKIDSMGMFINNFDEELNELDDKFDNKFDEFGTKAENAFRQLRHDTDNKFDEFGTKAENAFRQLRDDTDNKFGTKARNAFRQLRDDMYDELDNKFDNKFDEFGTKAENAFRQLRDDTDERYDGALERVGTVLEEIDDRLDRHDGYFDYINKNYQNKKMTN